VTIKEQIAREMKEIEECKKGTKEEKKDTCSDSNPNRRNNVLDRLDNRDKGTTCTDANNPNRRNNVLDRPCNREKGTTSTDANNPNRRNNVLLDRLINRDRKNVKFTSTPSKRVCSSSTQKPSSIQSVIFNGIAAMCTKLVYRFGSSVTSYSRSMMSQRCDITRCPIRFSVTGTCST